jgi:hypothetical protein
MMDGNINFYNYIINNFAKLETYLDTLEQTWKAPTRKPTPTSVSIPHSHSVMYRAEEE